MDNELGIDLDAIFSVIEDSEVFIVRFNLLDKRLLVDARTNNNDLPLIKLVPRVKSAEERYLFLQRERPNMKLPEQITVFEWPRKIELMQDLGVWQKLTDRLVNIGGDFLLDECENVMQEAIRLERADLLLAIMGGDGYETLWEKNTQNMSN
ncbi:MAG: hypothetical protein DK305_001075 [Chloroflexi bacterium]|jgi:hypothetical protein|nr:MAG: hypothetical protein DK305_001075 [Chloroflexota bacterium]|tara:strand:+ start:3670 stop:4125 length:456 start_codon:yes stop_codon:yes gene_type:complete